MTIAVVIEVCKIGPYGSVMPPREKKAGPSTLTVAKNLNHYRERAGLTMRELAAKMTERGFPLTHTVISQMENGARRIDVDDLSRLAYVLDVSISALLTPTPDNPGEQVGTTANPGDTAQVAIYRLYRLPLETPPWVLDAIDEATGAKWRQRIAGIQTVVAASETFNIEDDVEGAATFAWGSVRKEQKQSEGKLNGAG